MSIDRQMDKDVVHRYNRIPLNHRKERNNAICSNKDGPREAKPNKEKYIIYMWNLREMMQMNLCTKQKYTHRHRKQISVNKGESEEG